MLAVLSGVSAVLSAESCAAPTQIIVDVRAEKSLCNDSDTKNQFIRSTGIAVTTPDNVDDADLEVFEGPGCDTPPGDQIGLLTITPSGSKDAEVGIRVVSGVGVPADKCQGPDYKDCIVARRIVKFVPNQTVPVTIIMSTKCLGKNCPTGYECEPSTGACIPRAQIQEDGGTKPIPDASNDTNVEPGKDAEPDTNQPPQDAGFDACATCKGNCTNGNECTVDCNAVDCTNKSVCGQGLTKCSIICDTAGKCTGTSCNNPGACAFDCRNGGDNPHCVNIACSAGQECSVTCKDGVTNGATCNGVFLDGGKVNKVDCQTATVTCDNVHCTAGAGVSTCTRTCGLDAAACGPAGACTPPSPAAECVNWVDGGP